MSWVVWRGGCLPAIRWNKNSQEGTMDKDKTIALLNQDLEGEHGAIVQYLSHAYAMGEGEMACEIEAIAREEMRHLDWLAD